MTSANILMLEITRAFRRALNTLYNTMNTRVSNSTTILVHQELSAL